MENSIQEAMQLTKCLGLDGIEFALREPHLSHATSLPRVKEMKALADSLGLEIPVLAGYMGGFSTASDKEAGQAFEDFKRTAVCACSACLNTIMSA